jgi:hypothetical protein
MSGGKPKPHTLSRRADSVVRCAGCALSFHSSFWTSTLCNGQYSLVGGWWPCRSDRSRVADLTDRGRRRQRRRKRDVHESIDVSHRCSRNPVSLYISYISRQRGAMMRPRVQTPGRQAQRRWTERGTGIDLHILRSDGQSAVRSGAWQQPPRADRVED